MLPPLPHQGTRLAEPSKSHVRTPPYTPHSPPDTLQGSLGLYEAGITRSDSAVPKTKGPVLAVGLPCALKDYPEHLALPGQPPQNFHFLVSVTNPPQAKRKASSKVILSTTLGRRRYHSYFTNGKSEPERG